MDHRTWLWIAFGGSLAALLAIDLAGHRGGHQSSRRAAILWSVVWVLAGLAFGGFVWLVLGSAAAGEYLAAWLVEKSLSVDNLVVWLFLFRSLGVPEERQRRVLTWGIFGALVFRAVFVVAGAAALRHFEWVNYIFGALLLAAGWRVLREGSSERKESGIIRWLSSRIPVSSGTRDARFFVREGGRRVATPLFIALVAVEVTDVLFAVDSVPAALAITTDEFLVYSSNAFAILGLRSLYAVIAHGISRLRYLHWGLAGVLAFAGAKITLHARIEVPPAISVFVIALILGSSIGVSLARRASRASAAVDRNDGGGTLRNGHQRAPGRS